MLKARSISVAILSLLVAACAPDQPVAQQGATADNRQSAIMRWYEAEQVAAGEKLFQSHCVACHGSRGEGAAEWRKPAADGKYPAPPLNGTGHGWHHPLAILFQVIKHGSPGGQGNMPAWSDKLSDEQIIATIAWFQSTWSEEIYRNWVTRDAAARRR